MLARNKGLKKCLISLKINSDLWLKYFLLLDSEGSAAVVAAYDEQNNTLFMVHIYHSEASEIQTYKQMMSAALKGKPFLVLGKVHQQQKT